MWTWFLVIRKYFIVDLPSNIFYIYAESRSDYRDLVCIQAKMVDKEENKKELGREMMIKHNEEKKKKYSASYSPSCLFYFFFVFFLFSSSSSYPSRGVIVEFGRKTCMDWPLLYITHVIQTIISPYLPRIGHSDAPVPPDGDILDACHTIYCLQLSLL